MLSERGKIIQYIDLAITSVDHHNLRPQKIDVTDYVAKLEAVSLAARHFIRSVSAPDEPGNLSKGTVATYMFAQDLANKLEVLDD